jgi:hypothetical protein
MGSGPYRFVESKLGEYSKFEALEKHWLVVPEETTRVAML